MAADPKIKVKSEVDWLMVVIVFLLCLAVGSMLFGAVPWMALQLGLALVLAIVRVAKAIEDKQ